MLTSFSVTNANDAGAGSLRQAIISSDAATGPNSISFNITGTGVQTINLLSPLPAITQPVVIDGTTYAGYNNTGTPAIVVDGTKACPAAVGLTLQSSGSTVKGLVIDDFAGDGILINGASSNMIADDYLGVTAAGTGSKADGNGIVISGSAKGNVVTGSVISGNTIDGVLLSDAGTTANVVSGDDIGTDSAGLHAVPNLYGVTLVGGASGNTIGGTSLASRDIISGNTGRGVVLSGPGTSGNAVSGDYIGTDVAGARPLGNGLDGVYVLDGASSNTVGGATAGALNVISANGTDGVHIDSASYANLVEGDYIGTDSSGLHVLPNLFGVYVTGGSYGNTIGGLTAGARNVITGNNDTGVVVSGSGSAGNVVEGDYIGTDASGAAPLGNRYQGVVLSSGASSNTIGGTALGAGDVISANGLYGVWLSGAGTVGNVVAGDSIGTDSTGAKPLGNASDGVVISSGASGNTIGGSTAGGATSSRATRRAASTSPTPER